MRVRIAAIIALAVAAGACWGTQAEARVYVPGVRVVQEVRTAQGTLRSYHRPGLPPTYWDQSFPALAGDRVTLDALVATGGAELGEVRFSVDGKEMVKLTRGPWRTELDTANLLVGTHTVEARARTGSPVRETATKAALVIVPNDERAQHPVADRNASEDEQLSAAIGCLNPELDKALDERAAVVLRQPELFYASAGPAAKEFFYTLAHENKKVYYTSPLLPITTLLYLEPAAPGLMPPPGAPGTLLPVVPPQAPAPSAAKPGVPAVAPSAPAAAEPEEVILTLQVGDGEGHFGPPVWASVQLQPAPVAPVETPKEVKP